MGNYCTDLSILKGINLYVLLILLASPSFLEKTTACPVLDNGTAGENSILNWIISLPIEKYTSLTLYTLEVNKCRLPAPALPLPDWKRLTWEWLLDFAWNRFPLGELEGKTGTRSQTGYSFFACWLVTSWLPWLLVFLLLVRMETPIRRVA